MADGFELRLSLDEYLRNFSLDLAAPGCDAVNIAWDDQAHWHPHVLRWPELETICRAIAIHDPELSHPGHSVLLLHRFAPICMGEDLDAIVSTLESAWKQLGLFTEGEITGWIERIDARDAGFQWHRREPHGWVIEQDDRIHSPRGLYSLRQRGNDQFPFADWERMIDAAVRDVGRSGSADPESAEKPTPSACRPRRQWLFELRIPHQDADRPVSVSFGKLFCDTLDRILRSLNLGEADPSSARSMPNEDGTFTWIESKYSVLTKGERDEGLGIVRGLLWWSGAPLSTRLTGPGAAETPLVLDQPSPGSMVIVLQLGALKTVRWKDGYRFDRAPLRGVARERLSHVLSQWRALGPDEDGWFRITTAGAHAWWAGERRP